MSTWWAPAGEPHSRARHVLALIREGYEPIPVWLVGVVDRINELAKLDTVNPAVERPLSLHDAWNALDFMKRVMREDTCLPWIGRLSSGGVQLAWNHADVEVEAVFDHLRDEAAVLVSVGEREWDAPVDEADSLFANVADRLSNSYVATSGV